MPTKTPITVAHGDGIGPEIMDATLRILDAAGAALEIETIEIGEKVYLRGNTAGIDPSSWDSLLRTKVFLKAPITTPQGGGFRSLNVTIRTALGLYANVRPSVAYHPFVKTKHPGMNLVIVRENEEDLYVGIEYRPTADTVVAHKVITQQGCERIIRYAFEYARSFGRKKVTCFTKDNILKMSDGLFHKVYDAIAKEYPDIAQEHWIIDIGAAKMADHPEAFDVIVLPNLYGDILSDVAAQIAGSIGLAGSANIGASTAMFEAVHGSAPRRAGQNIANPSGLIMASIMMLVHLGKPHKAALIHNAWLKTIEEGLHTYDIYEEGHSRARVGTREFGREVAARLGSNPETLTQVQYRAGTWHATASERAHAPKEAGKELVGADIFIASNCPVEEIRTRVLEAVGEHAPLALACLANRGAILWPNALPTPNLSSHFRLRFQKPEHLPSLHPEAIISLEMHLVRAGLHITGIEHLYLFDGVAGFS